MTDYSGQSNDGYSSLSELERLQMMNTSLQEDNSRLHSQVEELSRQLQHYKLVSESFETRVLDLQKELNKRGDTPEKRKKANCQLHGGADIDASAIEMTDENGEAPEQFRKLFIGGLNYQTTTESLQEYFAQFGEIVDCVVMKDPMTKKSRGFGFVVYSKISMVDVAQDSRPHVVDGREVDTKRAVPRGDHITENQLVTKKIFVGGLKDSTAEEGLSEYFSRFGKVDQVDMIEDKSTNRRRGFAYVTFSDYDPVDKTVLQKYHTIDGRRCEVKKALSRVMMRNRNMDSGRSRNNGSSQQHPPWNNGPWGNNFDDMHCGPPMGACGPGRNMRPPGPGWNHSGPDHWGAGPHQGFGDGNYRSFQDDWQFEGGQRNQFSERPGGMHASRGRGGNSNTFGDRGPVPDFTAD